MIRLPHTPSVACGGHGAPFAQRAACCAREAAQHPSLLRQIAYVGIDCNLVGLSTKASGAVPDVEGMLRLQGMRW